MGVCGTEGSSMAPEVGDGNAVPGARTSRGPAPREAGRGTADGPGVLSRRRFLGAAAGAAFLGRALPRQLRVDPYALVLGVAQDGGMPQTGCYAPRCDRARQRDQPRYVSSLAIVEPDAQRYYLVDASPDLGHQMDLIDDPGFRSRAQVRRPFDGIFLTHAHMGHYLGLAELGREGLGMEATPCYCSPEMAGYLASNGPWSLLVDEGRLDLRPVEFDRWYEIDDSLSAMATPSPTVQSSPTPSPGHSGARTGRCSTSRTSTAGRRGRGMSRRSCGAWTWRCWTRRSTGPAKSPGGISRTFPTPSCPTRWICCRMSRAAKARSRSST